MKIRYLICLLVVSAGFLLSSCQSGKESNENKAGSSADSLKPQDYENPKELGTEEEINNPKQLGIEEQKDSTYENK